MMAPWATSKRYSVRAERECVVVVRGALGRVEEVVVGLSSAEPRPGREKLMVDCEMALVDVGILLWC